LKDTVINKSFEVFNYFMLRKNFFVSNNTKLGFEERIFEKMIFKD